jgi:hypothetical protein
MTEPELARILAAIDAALAIYQRHEGMLTADSLSVKSMLALVRKHLETAAARRLQQEQLLGGSR